MTTTDKLAAERAAFEAWYAKDANEQTGLAFTPERIAALREGDHYGSDRVALCAKWEGWQARAALEAEAKPAPAAERAPWSDAELLQVVEAVRAPLWKSESVKALRTALQQAAPAAPAPEPLTDYELTRLLPAWTRFLVHERNADLLQFARAAIAASKGGAA